VIVTYIVTDMASQRKGVNDPHQRYRTSRAYHSAALNLRLIYPYLHFGTLWTHDT
jgi:hypothetical protein